MASVPHFTTEKGSLCYEETSPGLGPPKHEDRPPDREAASPPPALFLHGMLGSRGVWREVIGQLGPRRVLAVDLPGHGESEPLREGRTLDDLALDLAALLDQRAPGGVFVFGLSLGANLALRLALARPALVAGLVLCSPQARAESAASIQRSRSTMQAAATLGPAPVLRALAAAMLGASTRRHQPLLLERWLHSVSSLSVPALLPLIEAALARDDLGPRLAALRPPALILRGEEDSLLSRAQAEELALLCRAPLTTLSGVGHLAPLEDPDHFVAAVRRYKSSDRPLLP